ncbi:AcrR family transcriptional regulator [Actinoplanes octamycinicus]|uniref:AcrR family transcriptional regulator n=1 Tax=Actinoplanes octamycinicus TaxID=135948 RepID=A0A7W7GYH0_9ACTN|nr:TetR/AcrR family transcriptional regulator [Actinoplanes octamycinicus]MBB4740593.1 AcrR family transcriptional regulator [Actinoplanes octamycinicus]GIE63106.1 TetR family transcriptional regulator [Actinoplanes octamycinicus]
MTATRRAGSETRAEILRVALELFTERGFEGTSIRDLSEALGMTKSSLYYHFEGKEAIIQALLASRRAEVDELLEWIDGQEPGPELLRRAALRWVDSTGRERILGMRFAHANGPTMARLAAQGGTRGWFDEAITRILGPDAPMPSRLRARMAFDTVSAALFAAQGQPASEADVLAAARAATIALTAPD